MLHEENLMERLASPLEELQQRFRELVKSHFHSVNKIIDHLDNCRGKLLRPIMVFIAAGPDFPLNKEKRTKVIDLALCIELVHTATLIHDDLIDNADTRRGEQTIHRAFGNTQAVLFGDFLFSHAFHLLSSFGEISLLRHLSHVTAQICEGEILQNDLRYKTSITHETYLKLIEYKTASLLSAACQLPAMLFGYKGEHLFGEIGKNLGIAYQIYDDCLDYEAETKTLGKPTFHDLRQGLITLPIIRLLEKNEKDARTIIEEFYKHPDTLPLPQNEKHLRKLLHHHACLEDSHNEAKLYRDKVDAAIEKVELLEDGTRREDLRILSDLLFLEQLRPTPPSFIPSLATDQN